MPTRHLSAVANENSAKIVERREGELRRPIYFNGVEVGYAYAQSDTDKRLSVRGLTIALFHFLAAGHQVLALLPLCFKHFADKSTKQEELLALHRMNLVEFTHGYGSEKYVEVNRLAAGAAFDSGGCIVARSQMHGIVGERPCLEEVVERRLLMPSFMGEDIIFPIDGPLGRIGPTLADTLACMPDDPDYDKCSRFQLTLEDQKIWLTRLSMLLPEKLTWASLSSRVVAWQPVRPPFVIPDPPVYSQSNPPPLAGPIKPPDTNSLYGRGFAFERRRQGLRDFYNCPQRHRQSLNFSQSDDGEDEFLPSYVKNDKSRKKDEGRGQGEIHYGMDYHERERHSIDEGEAHIGRPGSLYRIASAHEMSRREREREANTQQRTDHPRGYRVGGAFTREISPRRNNCDRLPSPPSRPVYTGYGAAFGATNTQRDSHRSQSDSPDHRHPLLSQLALIVGWDKAKRVTDSHPMERDLNKLANLAMDDNRSNSEHDSQSPPSRTEVRRRRSASRARTDASRSSVESSGGTRAAKRAAKKKEMMKRGSLSSDDNGRSFGVTTRSIHGPPSMLSNPLHLTTPDSTPQTTLPATSQDDVSSSDASTAIDLIDWDANPAVVEDSEEAHVSSTHLLDL